MTPLIEAAVQILQQSRHAAALTGAGISVPSGIPDFRSPESGVWENVDPIQVASIHAFQQDPAPFYQWIHPLARIILDAQPNPAHLALADLERRGPLRSVITQNIDLLHNKAGSQNVYEVHGHMRQATCMRCCAVYSMETILPDFVATGNIPFCSVCGGALKPNVVLFGEALPAKIMRDAQREALACDAMIVAGSSLAVSPVNELPLLAKQTGARLIFVNYGETHLDYLADVIIRADVADALPAIAAAFRNAGA